MIYIDNLKPDNIPFLQNRDTLYICDFRAIGESPDYKIPSMWKYENLLPWILDNKKVVVNEESSSLQYPNVNEMIITPRSKDPRISIFRRLSQKLVFDGVSNIWVGIPHPDANTLAKEKGIDVNFSFKDFLESNNKIKQKKLLQKMTPRWKLIKNDNDLENAINNSMPGYIKHRHGSGGHTIFLNHEINKKEDVLYLADDPREWFFEERIEGNPYSIQAVRFNETNKVIIFGFAEQIIEQSKYFTGASLLNLSLLKEDIFQQLEEVIKQLGPLIKNYEGFFGVDFILNENNKLNVLETNIRMTALTIPTLLKNLLDKNNATYKEDIEINEVGEDSIILGYESISGKGDILI